MKPDPHIKGSLNKEFSYNHNEEAFFDTLNTYIKNMELPTPQPRDDLPIVYIVGAPRSGTTLLSQLVSRHLDVGYINNVIARFWARPSVGIHLSRAILGENPDAAPEFKSIHGRTSNPAGPHEFGYFWRHWLKLDEIETHNLPKENYSKLNKEGLSYTLKTEFLGTFNKPLVFKAVTTGFYAQYLTEIHPHSLFIYLHRSPLDIARSLLHCRMERFNTYEQWWSLKPSTYPFDVTNPGEEVALQVRDCLKEMEQELSHPQVNTLHVEYTDLCANPRTVIENIASAMGKLGAKPSIIRNDFPNLVYHEEKLVPADLEKGLAKYL